MAADYPDPANDVFYRETLKALNRELARLSIAVMDHKRLANKMLDGVDTIAGAVKEFVDTGNRTLSALNQLVDINRETRDVMRDLREELVMARGDRRNRPTAPPIVAVPRTQTGG